MQRWKALTTTLIHSHYWLSGLVAGKLREPGMCPFVHMFHTLGHMKNRVATSDREMASAERIGGEQEVIEIADRIIAATPAEQAQLHWLYGNRSDKEVVISPGRRSGTFRAVAQGGGQSACRHPRQGQEHLFVGRIEPLKGVDTLLQAMALIQERYPTAVKNVM